jgi:mitochondrial fission protein ELM1
MGFRNVIVHFPTHRLTVVVLTNRDDPEPYFLALAIAKIYLPTADVVHAAHAATGPDSDAHP